ncbi:hypothetical protein PX52LOC_03595 [Limnoglobus roseus]|uniref:Uncharacterized protein n=1 Tax=Limnoglobus roseus TaxID=2598579 RepID=A0A5C1ADB6_9BACT|nr:hypothetical protein PX52LOC_03595 [Limnoglobus roseus]
MSSRPDVATEQGENFPLMSLESASDAKAMHAGATSGRQGRLAGCRPMRGEIVDRLRNRRQGHRGRAQGHAVQPDAPFDPVLGERLRERRDGRTLCGRGFATGGRPGTATRRSQERSRRVPPVARRLPAARTVRSGPTRARPCSSRSSSSARGRRTRPTSPARTRSAAKTTVSPANPYTGHASLHIHRASIKNHVMEFTGSMTRLANDGVYTSPPAPDSIIQAPDL